MSADQPLLLIFGGGDEADQIRRSGHRITIAGSSDLGKLLPDREKHHRLLITRNHPPRPEDFGGYPVIVNLITEAENSAMILGGLKEALRGVPGRVINPPDAVLRSTRDEVARLLGGIRGLIVPNIVRFHGSDMALAAQAIERAGLIPPIIVRQAGTHTGKSVRLCATVAEAVDGLERGKAYFGTQFIDFAGADGIYRKYRVYFIGQRVVMRHMYASDGWNVHSVERARFMGPRPHLVAEERALIASVEPFGPDVHEVFRRVRDRMPLDFFGLDFAVMPDGNVLLFEANATMSFFPLWRDDDPQFEYLTACVPPARAAFMELLGLSQLPGNQIPLSGPEADPPVRAGWRTGQA